ncbi:uncharacterized protein LAJ45_07818 [Morchella importuna]|uniref:uncharacterized protein n=1 Tax=Morchella importuna TaxID=1174673 RepID=UPI001E8DF7CE|nr:uncharacterized protein LAJ45_07818 [Morchella importuna]KAH8148054.1 hypothetical protein LAJ45_07818 [Morchella importuna]
MCILPRAIGFRLRLSQFNPIKVENSTPASSCYQNRDNGREEYRMFHPTLSGRLYGICIIGGTKASSMNLNN